MREARSKEGAGKRKVSIIIPCYKVEKYLRRCLDSVMAQVFREWEAICIDDGSPDNCGAILEEYAKIDSRFKVIHQQNSGLSAARNKGKKEASGDYIFFLDSDDAMHPQLVEIAYGLAQRYNADLVSFSAYKGNNEKFKEQKINPEGVKIKISNEPVFYENSKGKYSIHYNVWTKLYKKELLEGIDFISGICFEDYPHTFAVLARKPKTVITGEKLYFYQPHEGSISKQSGCAGHIRDYHAGINSVYEIYKTPSLKREFEFLKRRLIPNLLKQQLVKCRCADADNRPLMFAEFTKELVDLHNKGLISWRGHNLLRYLTYMKLIKDAI